MNMPSQIIQERAEELLNIVSNLYIGNLSPDVTEQILLKVFNKYGEVQSVKLMLPRNIDDKRRNCAFIKFASYEPAFLAKEALKEQHICGMSLKISWGK
jgi:U2-associated protein SR140